mmetsp:Transcript_8539/g.14400  ORF Transcript_8539/g.14400 Transcript_8539/m.14400 type:complete len:210 (-) Transcript_8539:295-924(-)
MGNSLQPSDNISLSHFHQIFPSLSHYIRDDETFADVFQAVQDTVEFLQSRNMDDKDRVYTKRTKDLHTTVRDIIKSRSNITPKRYTDIDMIVDYFSYAIIHGQDVVADAQKADQGRTYLYDWSKLVKGIPERTIKSHLAIQKELEGRNPEVAKDFTQISEQKAVQAGWESIHQKNYFMNIDKYEDLTFSHVPAVDPKSKPKWKKASSNN